MFKSLQTRIIYTLVIVVTLIMAIVGMLMYFTTSATFRDNFKSEISGFFSQSAVNEMSVYSNENNPDMILRYIYSNYDSMNISSDRTVMMLDSENFNILSTSNHLTKIPDKNSLSKAANGSTEVSIYYNPAYLEYAQPIPQDNPKYIIYIVDNNPEIELVLKNVINIVLLCLIAAILLALVVSFLLARKVTKPIGAIRQHAEHVTSGKFDDEFDIVSNDELGKLSDTINQMTNTLKSTINDMQTEKKKVDTILLYMTDGIIAFDKDGDIMHMNPEAKRMLNIDSIDNMPDFDSFFKTLDVDIKLGELLYLEHIDTVTRDIHTDKFDIKAYFAAFDEKEDSGGVIVVLQDVTQQEMLENARREFVANVSHELRTPLTTIRSYTETLIDGAAEIPDTRDKFLNIIINETERMIRIVQDLLVLSKLDFAKTKMNKDLFNFKELVLNVVDKFQISSKERGQHLKCHMQENIAQLYGDKHRLEQVLDNIVGNAIKYTHNGGKIDVYCKKLYNDIEIRVIDTGIGIPKEDLPRIFERFYRVDKARSREYGGTGLGLAIARDIIQSHDGTITINSVVGEGTEVIITLPALTVDKKRYSK